MVRGGDLYYEGLGFESPDRILDVHFSHLFFRKKMFGRLFEKDPKINEKEAGGGPFLI